MHRKLTCGSTFCNVGGCKTQIYLRLQLTKNRKDIKDQISKIMANAPASTLLRRHQSHLGTC